MKCRFSARVMAEETTTFDARAFADTVRASLIAGVTTARLDGMVRQIAAESGGASLSRLCLIVAQTCLSMGRIKQVRHWLERLVEAVADDDILAAIAVAVGCSQAELAVNLYQKLLAITSLPQAEESLAVAQSTTGLALRLRQRMRSEAWGLQRKLLKAVGQLLLGVLPALDSDEKRAEAWSCLAQIYRLRGLAQSQIDDALAEAARYGGEQVAGP